MAAEIASGQAYLHSRQIVHWDLKPENIFLTVTGTVRIGDFGLSSQRDAAFASPLSRGIVGGCRKSV